MPGTRAISSPIFDWRLPIGLVNQQFIDTSGKQRHQLGKNPNRQSEIGNQQCSLAGA